MPDTAILIRNNTHALATTRYALKAEQVAISIVKTPIQIPIPRNSPALIDIGIFRPSITISGLVDEQAGSSDSDFSEAELGFGFAGMTKFGFTRGGTVDSEYYYIPYKNKLEEAAYNWLAQDSTPLELELGNAKYPVYNKDVDGANADIDVIIYSAGAASQGEYTVTGSGTAFTSAMVGSLFTFGGGGGGGTIQSINTGAQTMVVTNSATVNLGSYTIKDLGTAHTTYDSEYSATGGAIYQVAIQQFRVEMMAAKEDRWQYTFQFVTKARSGVIFA